MAKVRIPIKWSDGTTTKSCSSSNYIISEVIDARYFIPKLIILTITAASGHGGAGTAAIYTSASDGTSASSSPYVTATPTITSAVTVINPIKWAASTNTLPDLYWGEKIDYFGFVVTNSDASKAMTCSAEMIVETRP